MNENDFTGKTLVHRAIVMDFFLMFERKRLFTGHIRFKFLIKL